MIVASEGGRFRYGGIARHVEEVAKEFSLRFSVTVLVAPSYCLTETPTDDEVAEETRKGVRYVYVMSVRHVQCLRSARFDPSEYTAAADEMLAVLSPILTDQFDALLLEDHFEVGLAFGLAEQCQISGFVYFSHLPLSARFSYFEKGVDESRQQVLEAAAMIGSEVIVTPSRYAMRTVRNVYPVSTGRIRIAPLAARRAERDHLPSQARGRTILTVARFSDQKGWNLFLAVAERIEQEGLSPSWRLIGDGANRTAVLDRLAAIAPRDRIRAERHLDPDAQLPEAMLDSAVFFLPSSYETFGLAPLEAAAHGEVPIVTGIGALEEIWGPHGMTFPPGDVDAASARIIALLTDVDHLIAEAATALKIADAYTWEAHCALLEEVLFA